ncbi:orexin receptor type 2-like [Gigantopelta aegis]|uniref:orexin receptor type 2-like n=1 Tax=Gigantopelta aegis TaxID=1735272 RepID=UPI001B888065|nr:orexin receptor type 2-like [Gigantopelta aegis]
MENISDYDLLMGNFDLSSLGISENYTIEDFIKVTTEYRKSDRWFDTKTELALILSFTTLSVLGLSGNCLVCIVILLRKTFQSSRNWYIFNLAVSDILTCILCKPFVIIRMLMKNWYMGEFMCKVVPALQTVYVFVSTLTILALSVDRYKAILYTTNRYKNSRVVRTIIPIIWTISFVVALPTFLTHEVEPIFYPLLSAVLEQLKIRFPNSDFLEHYKVFDRSFWPEDCGGIVDYHGQEDIKIMLTSSEMDLREEVQKLLDEDPNLDEDQAHTLKAAACLLAATSVKKAKAKSRERRVRRERKRRSVWVK